MLLFNNQIKHTASFTGFKKKKKKKEERDQIRYSSFVLEVTENHR